jgi:hypothetical protein
MFKWNQINAALLEAGCETMFCLAVFKVIQEEEYFDSNKAYSLGAIASALMGAKARRDVARSVIDKLAKGGA